MPQEFGKEPNPLQDLVAQCAEILNVLYAKQSLDNQDDKVHGEIKKELERMQQLNFLLEEAYQQALKETGISSEELQRQMKEGEEQMDAKSKDYILKIDDMKHDIERLRGYYKTRLDKLEGEKTGSKRADKEKKKQDFRNIGHRRGWEKL